MIQADNGRGTTSVSGGQGEIWETCVFSSNFCYEPKTDLKKRKSHTQNALGTKDLAEECQTASFIWKSFIIAFSVRYFINIC